MCILVSVIYERNNHPLGKYVLHHNNDEHINIYIYIYIYICVCVCACECVRLLEQSSG